MLNSADLLKHASLLVVDDMDNMLRINKKILESLGYQDVETTTNGREAIDKIRHKAAMHGSYDLMLLDWNMPTTHGMEVLRQLRGSDDPIVRQTAVLMVTAESTRENVLLAIQAGVNDYIVKPYSPDTLGKKLHTISERLVSEIDQQATQYNKTLAGDIDITEELRQKELKKVRACFEHCLRLAPSNTKAILKYIDFLTHAGQLKEAEECLRYYFGINRTSPEGFTALGKIELKRTKYPEAVKALLRARQLKADHLPALEYLGEAYLLLKDYNAALGCFQEIMRILDAKKGNMSAIHLRGMGEAYEGMNMIDKAGAHYMESVSTDPKYISAYYQLVGVLKAQGQGEKATKMLERASSIEPRTHEEWLDMGKVYLEMGRPEMAEEAFGKSEAMQPQNSHLKHQIGSAFQAYNYLDKAEDYFLKTASSATTPEAFNKLGMVLRRKGKVGDAIVAYEKALKLDPENERILFNLAVAKAEGGMRKASVEHLRKALTIAPSFQEAKDFLHKMNKELLATPYDDVIA